MQSYTEIAGTTSVKTSRQQILDNDKTIMSCSSGAAFPTANLQVGMLCYRTDKGLLYILANASPVVWLAVLLGDEATSAGFEGGDLSRPYLWRDIESPTDGVYLATSGDLDAKADLSGAQFSGPVVPGYKDLSATSPTSGAIQLDASAGNVFYLGDLTGAASLSIINGAPGQAVSVRVYTGGNALSLATGSGGFRVAGSPGPANYASWLNVVFLSNGDSVAVWEGAWTLVPT